MGKSNETRTPKDDHLANLRRGELKRFFRHEGVTEAEVYNRVEDILTERQRWSALDLGRRINLTFNDKILLGIRTIKCFDKTPAEVRAYFRERKRTRDRIRKKKFREMHGPKTACRFERGTS